MDFPSSPAIGQEHSIGSRTWRYNGVGWQIMPDSSIGTNAQGNKTISTGPPINTSPGDIHYQVES